MRRGPAGAMQERRRLVGTAQSVAADGRGGRAGEVVCPHARAGSMVYIGVGETVGVGLFRLGGNARLGAVRTRRPARWRRWRAEGCRGGVSRRLGRVCAQGGAKGQDRWPWRALSGPLGRGRTVDEVHRRRTGGRRRSREGKGTRDGFVISKSLETSL